MNPLPPSNPQDSHAAIVFLIVLAACLCVRYWTIALRVLLIAAIALAVYGAIAGVQGLESLTTPSHH